MRARRLRECPVSNISFTPRWSIARDNSLLEGNSARFRLEVSGYFRKPHGLTVLPRFIPPFGAGSCNFLAAYSTLSGIFATVINERAS
jgi:hypothetical protein